MVQTLDQTDDVPQSKALLLVDVGGRPRDGGHVADGALVDVAPDADWVALAGEVSGWVGGGMC